jgi:hypothetical protein
MPCCILAAFGLREMRCALLSWRSLGCREQMPEKIRIRDLKRDWAALWNDLRQGICRLWSTRQKECSCIPLSIPRTSSGLA